MERLYTLLPETLARHAPAGRAAGRSVVSHVRRVRRDGDRDAAPVGSERDAWPSAARPPAAATSAPSARSACSWCCWPSRVTVDFPEGRARLQGRRGDLLQPGAQPGARLRLRLRAPGSDPRLGGVPRARRDLPEARQSQLRSGGRRRSRSCAGARWTIRFGPACTTPSRTSTRSSPRRSCSCSAPTAFWCCTRCCSASICSSPTRSSPRRGSRQRAARRLRHGVPRRVGRARVCRLAHSRAVQLLGRALRVLPLELQGSRRRSGRRRGGAASCAAADPTTRPRSLIGVLTFSKPTHARADVPAVRDGDPQAPVVARVRHGAGLGADRPAPCSPATPRSPASSTIRAATARRSTASPAFRSPTIGRRSRTSIRRERREAVLPVDVLVESAHAHGVSPQPGLLRRRPIQRADAVFLSRCREPAAVSRDAARGSRGSG